ncbi:MAG TPA: hypothetical protein VFP63_02030 [Dehalococcoidia bacterium]|nr:hypothetical protein [Dehalococcoidia bacterium]
MDDVKREYRKAYEDWQAQLTGLHRVLLNGERLEPPKLKALLNREARAFERFEAVRRRLLGLSD